MDLHYYKPNDIENWINAKYQENGIRSAADLDLDYIASIFDIDLDIGHMKSFTKWEEGQYSFIIISDKLSLVERREHFFHELCHPLRHIGRQHTMSYAFRQLQEIQASHFQLYAAMPVFMLEAYADFSPSYLVRALCEDFGLSEKFVTCRLKQIQGRIQLGRQDAEIKEQLKKPVKFDMDHVRRIMEELGRKREERKRREADGYFSLL